MKVKSPHRENPSEFGILTSMTSTVFVSESRPAESAIAKTSFLPHDDGKHTPM